MAESRRWLAALALVAGCSPWVSWEPPDVTPIDPPPLAGQEQGDSALGAFDDIEAPKADPVIERLRREGEAIAAIVESDWVKRFARGTAELTPVASPYPVHDAAKDVTRHVDTELFYYTKYGSPLAYARPLDLVAQAGMAAPHSAIDFGYGTIGHLRLLATLGARAVGIDVDPLLRDMYADHQGRFSRGSVKLLHGAFPSDLGRAETAGGHELFMSKNVLKNGYIHPAEDVPKKQTIDLGVSDEAFVDAIAGLLAPGGYAMIYSITPPPNGPGLPYRTWADGRCPFPKPLWEAAGFEVLAFDVDDSAAARRQGRALGWDADGDLEESLFASYTLARKRAPK